MARKKDSGLDVIAALPWQAGLVVGVLAYLGVRYGVGALLSSVGGPLLAGVGEQVSGGMLTPLAWLALAVCWIAAGVSFIQSRQRKQLLDTQTGIDSLRGITWPEFEMLVGEAFRRRGYTVEETGLGGKDGGIDLIVRKDGHTDLVQCKQWKNHRVDARTIREMWGLVDHHRADGVHIVCCGDFTPDAARFAHGKAITLITGQELLAMIREVQASPARERIEPTDIPRASARDAPARPACGEQMKQKTNRGTGQRFWGCSRYPRCRGTRALCG